MDSVCQSWVPPGDAVAVEMLQRAVPGSIQGILVASEVVMQQMPQPGPGVESHALASRN